MPMQFTKESVCFLCDRESKASSDLLEKRNSNYIRTRLGLVDPRLSSNKSGATASGTERKE